MDGRTQKDSTPLHTSHTERVSPVSVQSTPTMMQSADSVVMATYNDVKGEHPIDEFQSVKVNPKCAPSVRRLGRQPEPGHLQTTGKNWMWVCDVGWRQQTGEFHYDNFNIVRIQGIVELPGVVQVCQGISAQRSAGEAATFTDQSNTKRYLRHWVTSVDFTHFTVTFYSHNGYSLLP